MIPHGRKRTWKTNSPAETLSFGENLGRRLAGGLTVGLVGPLGAGKTLLVKGIAVGNGADDSVVVTSPTFTLVHEYPGKFAMYHLDAYRLSGAAEVIALGFDEMIGEDSAVIVEWADRVAEAMPEDTLWIDLAITGQTSREFVCKAGGPIARRCLDALCLRPG